MCYLVANFLGHIYGRARRYVRTFSGRRRYNVLGALDYVTRKILVVTNDGYITATEVCRMLHKVAAEYGGKKGRSIHNGLYSRAITFAISFQTMTLVSRVFWQMLLLVSINNRLRVTVI